MGKKKILLVTLQGYFNYGNRLQNYALQEMLKCLGYEVHTLMAEKHLRTYAADKWKFYIKHVLTFLGVKHFRISYSDTLRRKRLFGFTRKYIDNLEFMDNEAVWNRNWDEYDCAVTGSDQVWHNWHTIDKELEFYYLQFINKEKRVSYAPSFGFKEFPKEDIDRHKIGLLGIRALSCREKEGCDLIHGLIGREPEWLLDPTLVLSREKWEQFEEKPSFVVEDGKYIFVYFLGFITDEYKNEIDRLSEKYGVPVINASDMLHPEQYSITPNEFVWLIHHAAKVCTDSFHGTVFSILFEKNTLIFERSQEGANHMFGRISDLVRALGMEHILYRNSNAYDEEQTYNLSSEARAYLSDERNKAYSFLKRSIEGN
ncbi:MAG: polysaccharide pyruvyl transferase family protein [Oscillospiraceae bacterium]|nr:polysaccharide pyruvyl transferase family protein [Oscillospiraceae bacterium]